MKNRRDSKVHTLKWSCSHNKNYLYLIERSMCKVKQESFSVAPIKACTLYEN